ncbi:MAG: DUF177 domain-containing protein [Tannerella sp.]|jgi:uncharacterized metal-binding protein YceD (DUF177 family)|nr:DUF177 domain-containing protein [Tannerella sp.]
MSPASTLQFDYELDNIFFDLVEGTEVKQGKVSVTVQVTKISSAYELHFHTEGAVTVECDRCLGDMEIPVEADNKLVVTLGETYSETSDEHVTVSEEEGMINVAWFMYEFIVLALPLKRVHPAGECDEKMASKLREYSVEQADGDAAADSENVRIDARWEALRKLTED